MGSLELQAEPAQPLVVPVMLQLGQQLVALRPAPAPPLPAASKPLLCGLSTYEWLLTDSCLLGMHPALLLQLSLHTAAQCCTERMQSQCLLCRAAFNLAKKLGVDAPIMEGIYRVLHEDANPVQVSMHERAAWHRLAVWTPDCAADMSHVSVSLGGERGDEQRLEA